MATARDAVAMANDPAVYFGGSGRTAHHLPRPEWEALQLEALRERFSRLRDRLPALKAMADEQNIVSLDSIADVAPLLFPHTVYKSYPVSLLENGRFAQLNRWLGRLTTLDLSQVDVSACDSIDGWLDLLDAQTDVRVLHSSGTTGTLSLLPRAQAEFDAFHRTQHMALWEFLDPGEEQDHDQHFDVVWPTYSGGRSGLARAAPFFRNYVAGSPERFHPLIEGRMSADVMFLAGRLRLATARGEADRIEISPRLMARRAEFEATRVASQNALDNLFENLIVKLKGRRVFLIGMMAVIHDLASKGLEQGMRHLFAPGSVVQTGGGAKGVVLPADWERTAMEFTGVSRLAFNYGMTEICMSAYICEHGHYHVPPWVVTMLLDPDSGAPLPRSGVQVGRAAFFDLIPQTYWGGFVSGDEITVDWNPCACGRSSAHMHKHVQRYSEKRGGDDKISCAASEEAHQAALDLLRGQLA